LSQQHQAFSSRRKKTDVVKKYRSRLNSHKNFGHNKTSETKTDVIQTLVSIIVIIMQLTTTIWQDRICRDEVHQTISIKNNNPALPEERRVPH
jgi:hypothetical protein